MKKDLSQALKDCNTEEEVKFVFVAEIKQIYSSDFATKHGSPSMNRQRILTPKASLENHCKVFFCSKILSVCNLLCMNLAAIFMQRGLSQIKILLSIFTVNGVRQNGQTRVSRSYSSCFSSIESWREGDAAGTIALHCSEA